MHEFYQRGSGLGLGYVTGFKRLVWLIISKSGFLSIVHYRWQPYNQSMTHQRSSPVGERDRKSLWAINLGLILNIILSVAKTTFGILTHSPALLAEGINSTSDVAYYVVASIFMRLAKKPADNEHPYGHRQLESIASLVVGAFVVATAIAVFWDSVDKMWDLMDGKLTTLGSHPFALWVALPQSPSKYSYSSTFANWEKKLTIPSWMRWRMIIAMTFSLLPQLRSAFSSASMDCSGVIRWQARLWPC